MKRGLFVLLFVLSAALSQSNAAPIIDVGSYSLLPNTPDQKIIISISGGDSLTGLNLFAQVGDGGPELANDPYLLPPGTPGPAITSVNLKPVSGIFAGVADDETPIETGLPQVKNSSIAILEPGGFVSANGILAELTIDTTGFTTGHWDLLLSNVLNYSEIGGPFATAGVAEGPVDVPFEITNGSIDVTPEPATLALLALGGLAFVRRRGSRAGV